MRYEYMTEQRIMTVLLRGMPRDRQHQPRLSALTTAASAHTVYHSEQKCEQRSGKPVHVIVPRFHNLVAFIHMFNSDISCPS